MKKRGFKKGVSPVISTVLLIALVFIIAVIIFIWARGFIKEKIEKFPGEDIKISCDEINLEVEATKSGIDLTLNLVNNGKVPIYNIAVREYKGASKDIIKYDNTATGTIVDIGRANTIKIQLSDSNTKKIGIVPILLGKLYGGTKTKEYTCYESEIPYELQ